VPSPPPPARSRGVKERDTEIDIHTGRGETEIDIHQHTSHSHERHRPSRSRSRSRSVSPLASPSPSRSSHHGHGGGGGRIIEEEIIVHSGRDTLDVSDHVRRGHGRSRSRPRARSEAPTSEYTEEAEYITTRINSRGEPGEAYHGRTRDWTIVDVPPGTERVHMDGAGGGAADVTWRRYNGVRRAKFLPDGGEAVTSGALVLVANPERDRDRERERARLPPSRGAGRGGGREERVSVQVIDGNHEIDVDAKISSDRRVGRREPAGPPARRRQEMWTEITKDLVIREAIEQVGYEYEETEWFFYIMQYLQYVSPGPSFSPLFLLLYPFLCGC
jgi:hypothetical protein